MMMVMMVVMTMTMMLLCNSKRGACVLSILVLCRIQLKTFGICNRSLKI